MNLWIVVLVVGRVVASLGPVVGDRELCLEIVQDRTFLKPIIEQAGYELEDVTIDCVYDAHRPRVGTMNGEDD